MPLPSQPPVGPQTFGLPPRKSLSEIMQFGIAHTDDGGPQKGDWVKVWAQVTDPSPHSDEFEVRVWSHNMDYTVLVRRDHTEQAVGIPDFAERCYSLFDVEVIPMGYPLDVSAPTVKALIRCSLHNQHAGNLGGPAAEGYTYQWTSKEEASGGYAE